MLKRAKNSQVVFNLLHSDERGGIEEMYINYTSILQSLNYYVICIIPTDFKYIRELDNLNINYKFLNIRNYYDMIATYNLHKLIKKYQPKFIFSHKGRSHSIVNHWQRFYKTKYKPITFGVCHGCDKRTENFDCVIVVSRYLLNTFQQKSYSGELFYLPNFLSTNIPFAEYSIDKKTNKQSQLVTLGVLGRLSPEKNISLAINAIAYLKTNYPKASYHLKIAGDGKEKENLIIETQKLGLNSEITFIGWIVDKKSFFNSIDLLLVPSKFEPFGMIILESYYYRTPVIASNIAGPAEIITHNVNGLLFETENFIDLAKNIANLFESDYLIETMITNAVTTLSQTYSKNAALSNMKTILKTVTISKD